jgi:hypothetical protein
MYYDSGTPVVGQESAQKGSEGYGGLGSDRNFQSSLIFSRCSGWMNVQSHDPM